MSDARYILLYCDHRRVRAAEATDFVQAHGFPSQLRMGAQYYRKITLDNISLFWDEFRDSSNRTVGYSFLFFDPPLFAAEGLWSEADNVVIEASELQVFLADASQPVLECVQGFDSAVYVNASNPSDHLMLMLDWSENPKAFPLETNTGCSI